MHIKPILFVAFALASGAAFAQHTGTVESVQKVERTEKAKGIAGTPVTPGMAIGGVVGGVLGNQIGSGSGRGAATVLGAAGGAYAGHQVERHNRRYVAYVMKVRMDDGGWRTVEQRTPIARGSHVVVEGHTARLERREPRHG
ncbi:MAG TPA: glycine zipper 2TM domain-containing protein [Ramlibacter sp.]|jgi:outer membrane lipoprotein SlyB|nr:glycine zipper 2TM domain-containing protein [Ramlibacter sp.]